MERAAGEDVRRQTEEKPFLKSFLKPTPIRV